MKKDDGNANIISCAIFGIFQFPFVATADTQRAGDISVRQLLHKSIFLQAYLEFCILLGPFGESDIIVAVIIHSNHPHTQVYM